MLQQSISPETLSPESDERGFRRGLIGSSLLHGLLLLGLSWLSFDAAEEPPLPVFAFMLDKAGVSGAAGGAPGGGDRAMPESTAAASPETATQPPAEAAEAPERNTEPAHLDAADSDPEPPPAGPVPRPRRKPEPPQTARAEPRQIPPPRPRAQAAAPPTPAASQPSAPPAALPGTRGNQDQGLGGPTFGGASNQAAGSGAGDSGTGPGDDYLDRLRRWLARHKRYPEEARRQKQEGRVLVAFTIARDGTVTSADIERSSGYPALDLAVLQLLRDASPVQPLPPHYPGQHIELVMPIDYSLGFFSRLFR